MTNCYLAASIRADKQRQYRRQPDRPAPMPRYGPCVGGVFSEFRRPQPIQLFLIGSGAPREFGLIDADFLQTKSSRIVIPMSETKLFFTSIIPKCATGNSPLRSKSKNVLAFLHALFADCGFDRNSVAFSSLSLFFFAQNKVN